MKPLDKIFTPDIASLDVRIGPLVFGKSEDDYEKAALAELHDKLSGMACTANVPAHIQQNIELSKNLLLYSIYVFDFTTAAVHYAQIALEGSLRRALGKSEECRDNIDKMLKEAVSRKILSEGDHEHIVTTGFISRSRNGIAHGKETRNVFNHALAIPFVQLILDTINTLFSSSQSEVQVKADPSPGANNLTDNSGETA
jgi:hypothetical protein